MLKNWRAERLIFMREMSSGRISKHCSKSFGIQFVILASDEKMFVSISLRIKNNKYSFSLPKGFFYKNANETKASWQIKTNVLQMSESNARE